MAKLTLYNIAICLVVALGGFTFGFGSSTFVVSIGQPGFYEYYNLNPTSLHTANTLDAINALFYLGGAIGAIGQSFLADWLGRKRALVVASLLALVGNALVAGSAAVGMLMAVRVIQGAGLGMLLALVPLYLTEVAPPHARGFLTGLTTFSYSLGYVACGWISVGCYHITNLALSWRLPLALGCIPPLALPLGLYFIPESPRYLVWRERHDEAWTTIKHLHHEEYARAEFTQIVYQVAADRAENATFAKMFTKPTWRRRSLLAMFIMFAAECTGVLGITNYLPLIFTSLGFKNDLPLILYATNTSIGTIFVLINMLVVDRIGRRTLFLTGFIALAGVLLAEALLQWKFIGTDNKSGNEACVALIFLYNVVFQCIDAPAFIWAAEIFPTTIRAKGLSLALLSLFVGIITFTAPAGVAFKNIGWHMYLVYCGLSTIAAVIVYFCVPETKGLPVEEIGALFGDEVVVHVTSDGLDIVEMDTLGPKQAAEQVEDSVVTPIIKV